MAISSRLAIHISLFPTAEDRKGAISSPVVRETHNRKKLMKADLQFDFFWSIYLAYFHLVEDRLFHPSTFLPKDFSSFRRDVSAIAPAQWHAIPTNLSAC
jgi:hypothetical protein